MRGSRGTGPLCRSLTMAMPSDDEAIEGVSDVLDLLIRESWMAGQRETRACVTLGARQPLWITPDLSARSLEVCRDRIMNQRFDPIRLQKGLQLVPILGCDDKQMICVPVAY